MENPASSSPCNVLAQPQTAAGGGGDNTIPQEKPQNAKLSSPQIPPSPSMPAVDLAQTTSPQLQQPQSQVLNPAAALDYYKQQPVQSQQLHKEQAQAQPQNLIPPSSMQPNFQQSGSMQRLSQIQQQLGATAAASGAVRQHAGMCSGQINFGGNQIQQQQQLAASAAGMARSGMTTQAGPLAMPGQTAQHFNLPPQMLAQPRQKSLTQGAQLSAANSSGQAMQGMQNMGMIGTLGLNPQLRAYGQHRLMQGQIRQQLSQQMALKSAQKLPGQSSSRAPSAAALNTQVSGLTQNGQSVAQTTLSQQQQQWLKHLQPPLSSVSPSYHIQQQQRQQHAFLPQQLASSQMQQKSMALTQQQISQLVQQPQLGSQQQQQQHLIHQQQLQQYQQLQQQQQLQSSSLSESAMQKSLSLTGSQLDTPASGTTMLGSQGIDRKLLGKRKIHDLVVQVDPRGKLDPEVEDLLLEIADDFIDSVTTFACSLAKHRKSSTLETKDVLLHLEKNWNLAVPGYSSGEKVHQKRSLPLDIHKNRMEMIRELAERHKSEGDVTTSKVTNNQIINNSRSDLPIKSSPSSELLPLPVSGSESMHKLQRI